MALVKNVCQVIESSLFPYCAARDGSTVEIDKLLGTPTRRLRFSVSEDDIPDTQPAESIVLAGKYCD